MKATELQIGDWVQIVEPCKYAGVIGTIKTLIDHKDDENAYFKVFLRNNTIHIGIEDICSDDIKPIPLEKIHLEKNGFEYKEGETGMYGVTTVSHYICDGVPFEIFCDGEPFAIWFKEPVNIKYVHQLQHALRLCGISKEIEL